jgi:hypothetical protein
MNDSFCTISQYIESKTTLVAKIAAYDLIISGLETTMLLAVESGHVKQYEYDDSMMKVRAEYRSVDDIANAMIGYEKIRQMYINRLNGRITVLRGGNL